VRAAFVVDDVLAADETALGQLRRLQEADLKVVVLHPREPADGRVEVGGLPVVACPDGEQECWGSEPTLLLDAARRSGATPSEAFLVCSRLDDAVRGADAGCRPILVLGGRTMDEVYGPAEPAAKEAACAPDCETAVQYILDESAQSAALGAFPYAPVATLEERARTEAPSRADVTKLLTVVVTAGIAVALGIAYILQEVYQNYRFPAVFYYLTLQPIPQAMRGALFLLIGAVAAVVAVLTLNRLPFRRRSK
jgi:hypothetical protein